MNNRTGDPFTQHTKTGKMNKNEHVYRLYDIVYYEYMLVTNIFVYLFLDEIIFDKLLFVAWLDQLVPMLRLSSWLDLVWAPKMVFSKIYYYHLDHIGLYEFHFRWLKMKRFDAAFHISMALFCNHLN